MAGKKEKSGLIARSVRTAAIEFAHKDLQVDAEGKLWELPGLLDVVNDMLGAISSQEDGTFDFDTRPYSTAGRYGFALRMEAIPPNRDMLDGETDPFHSLVVRMRFAWQKVEENAKSANPKPLKDVGVSTREFRTLKALGQVQALHVEPGLRTADGRLSQFPVVDSDLLAKVLRPEPQDQSIDAPVTGVAYNSDGVVLLCLNYSRVVAAPRLSLADACSALRTRAARAIGQLTCVDGALEFQGESLFKPPQRELALP